jgi:hypothetical protein
MQQIRQHRAVGDIGRCRHHRMDQLRTAVDRDMRLQKVAVVAVLAASLLGFVALLLLDCLPQFLLRLGLVAPLAALSRETRRLFMEPSRSLAVLALSAVTIGFTILGFKLVSDGVGSHLPLGNWISACQAV